ncbi:MAG: hypothetical protein DRJ42_02900 [Deltaproteobacteria bacterium]|nr:MAG: hypothetical protein DRJ42_02900 [Deltaproteobacteria bacterium]
MARRDRFVTIATIQDPVRAEVLKDILAQEGIEATIAGANHSALFGQVGAFVTIHLQVLESRAVEASELIEALDEEDVELVDDDEASFLRTADHADYGDPRAIHDAGAGPYREGPPKRGADEPKRSFGGTVIAGVALTLVIIWTLLALR